MLKHNFLLVIRSIKKYKGSFLINIIGLTIGLTCVLLILLWVNDEVGVDKFHEKDRWLYQMMRNFPAGGGEIVTHEGNPALLAQALKKEMPEVEHAVAVVPPFWYTGQGIIAHGEKQIKADAQFAGEAYFKMFSWKLLQGNKEGVLSDKYGMVISDELADKLFPSTANIIGKPLQLEWEDYTGPYYVAGVFEKLPQNTTENFDVLLPYELYFQTNLERMNLENWGNSNPRTYLTLKEGADEEAFNKKISGFIATKHEGSNSTLFLRNYSDKYLHGRYENGKLVGGRIDYVYLFSGVALFVLLIACINFMNLSVARASRRIKEIGIKKAIGAGRKTLMLQFLGESILTAFFSLILAVLLVLLLLPGFNSITGKQLGLTSVLEFLWPALTIALLTGLIAGCYPAIHLSGFRPVAVLKGTLKTSSGELWVRKGLVVFQFAISIILIVSVLIVHGQTDLIQSKNLGYNRENIVVFKREGNLEKNYGPFMDEVRNMPEVSGVSSFWHDLFGLHGGTGSVHWEGKDPEERIEFKNLEGSYDLLQLLGIEMAEGRAFSREFKSDTLKVIFNERAIEAMELQEPIGKTIKLWGQDRHIIGVARDFHLESLYEPIKPTIIQCYPIGIDILVKIRPGMERAAIDRIGDLYDEYNQGLPFDFRFMDQDYQKLYASETRVVVLSRYFAGLAILISCLGLFGLAVHTVERRRKEVGIRKVLGQSTAQVTLMLSGEFAKLVLIAILIALPVAYLLTNNWLSSFAYRIPLQIWNFLAAALAALSVAMLTVGSQAIKAANNNPVDGLRDE
ncbi:ABC transporter permease [Muricauda sp. SCSIO 64092]|uniref:ABC transporter permease n=1 Tax=Allomuricauda sp. SCSIO 64092 TaxID=2908842 RepID=UPI001FF1A23B|nr:ABC transporter permease [Muricauda sp. SCSIO 64092]UOY08072.1 ABC transporter permease [Muricauda sp. SCSIO 64092]